MSGIFGIHFLNGAPVSDPQLKRMSGLLAHRGPDGEGRWCDHSVGLGHRMLCTTPEAITEQVPLVDRAGSLVITADARLDNRVELISALGVSANSSDGELILAAYRKWGEACPEHLLGDFAFAIWDARDQSLFCARDHFGVRPFYYYLSQSIFVFATEIKALFSMPEVQRKLNEVRLGDHLA